MTPEDREVCRLLSSKLKDFEKETHALSQTWVQSREGTPTPTQTPTPSVMPSSGHHQHQQPPPPPPPNGRPDSLLQEKIDDRDEGHDDFDPKHVLAMADDDEDDDDDGVRAEGDERMQVGGGNSPCYSGGLHMPDKRHISDFVRRVKRLRYFSQCLPIGNAPLQGSPVSGSSVGTVVDSLANSSAGTRSSRKRSTSCMLFISAVH